MLLDGAPEALTVGPRIQAQVGEVTIWTANVAKGTCPATAMSAPHGTAG